MSVTASHPGQQVGQGLDAEPRRAAMSAWVDGEGTDVDWAALWEASPAVADAHIDETLALWQSYHLIGDVLRTGHLALAQQPSADDLAFARRVTAMAQRQEVKQPSPVLAQPPVAPSTLPAKPPHAANDSVYRWRMVAGFASFSAVLGIAWGVWGGSGALTGAELAQNTPPATVAVVSTGATAVLVATPQGDVVRDARLQELVHTHRRSGGVNMWQAPAGFLRTSALDGPSR